MTRTTVLLAFAALSALGGYWLGAQRPSPTNAVGRHLGDTSEPIPALPDQPAGSVGHGQVQALKRELEAVKVQLVRERAAHAQALARSEGTPIVWSPDIPEKFREDAFRTTLSKVLESCVPGSELMAVECIEYPCIAALRSENANIVDCTTWMEAYDDSNTITTDQIQCPDGHQETVVFLSPLYDRVANDNVAKRAEVRWRDLKDRWRCLPSQ